MQLQSSILIHRTPEQVWSFLGDPANVPKWDRGVAAIEDNASQPRDTGYEFNTVAHDRLNLPDQGRMTYRVKESKTDESNPQAGRCIVELTSTTGNARFFKTAEWRFNVRPYPKARRSPAPPPSLCAGTISSWPQYSIWAESKS